MNKDKIADLYSAGEISGFAYLACVEREIYTVEDAIAKGFINNSTEPWVDEIRAFVETPISDTDTTDCPDSDMIAEQWNEIKKLYSQLSLSLDVRTATAVKIAEKWYASTEDFLSRLLTDDSNLWVRFKSLRAVGQKSIQRASAFANALQTEISALGISIKTLLRQHKEGNDSELESFLGGVVFSVSQDEFSRLSVRSFNALKIILKECDNSYSNFYRRITSKEFDVWKMRNVGRKSVPEIKAFIKYLEDSVAEAILQFNSSLTKEEYEEEQNESMTDTSGSEQANNLDSRQTIFEARMHELSTRAFHAVLALYEKSGNSVQAFMKTVTSPDFRVSSLPAVGRKTTNEITLWINSLRTLLTSDDVNISSLEKEARTTRISRAGIKGNAEQLEEISSRIGHFSFFAAIEQYLLSLDDRDKAIVLSQLKIYKGQALLNRKESSKKLGISAERIRQLRIALFKKLSNYVHWLIRFKNDYGEFSYSKEDIGHINELEETNFNDNFIIWVLSIIQPNEFKLYGDVDVSFSNPYGYEKNLAIIPKSLESIFDFNGFIRYFEALTDVKRVDDQCIPLREFALNYFKDRIHYESLDEIEKECRYLIIRLTGFDIINGSVVVGKNATRNNTEWVEIIIREAGHPLTIEEIYKELERRDPGKSKSPLALSGAVRTNPNLVPIGRSSTFGLREWSNGSHRGGTIREFATEYLLSLEKPIALLPDIAKYVRQYRPSSSDKSIYSNLLMEANGAFDVFFKDDNRYIGLSNFDYGEEYRRFDHIKDAKRDFKTSCTLLEEFVAENGRLPFSNKVDDEEKRLARFWNVQLSLLEKGKLDGEEKQIIEAMASRFSGLKIHKKEYDWLQSYNTIRRAIENRFDISSLSPEKQQWLTKQINAYKYGRLSPTHTTKIEELIKLIQANVKRV